MLFHLSSGIVLRNLALTKGRGEMYANSLTGFGKRMIWTFKTLLKTLSLWGGRGGIAPNVIYGIRMLFHLRSGNVLRTLT
jgi:hypothetical protein